MVAIDFGELRTPPFKGGVEGPRFIRFLPQGQGDNMALCGISFQLFPLSPCYLSRYHSVSISLLSCTFPLFPVCFSANCCHFSVDCRRVSHCQLPHCQPFLILHPRAGVVLINVGSVGNFVFCSCVFLFLMCRLSILYVIYPRFADHLSAWQ